MEHREPSGCTPDLDVNCDGKVDGADALAMLIVLAEPPNVATICD
jgi:hypothetical protein